MHNPPDDQIAYGIEIQGFYDGVAVWVLKDGTKVNRFADTPGWEELAKKIDTYLEEAAAWEKEPNIG